MIYGSSENTTNVGYFYMTVLGYVNSVGETIEGTLTFSFEAPQSAILVDATHLQALKDLYYTTCQPTQLLTPVFNPSGSTPNDYWRRGGHQTGLYRSGPKKQIAFNYVSKHHAPAKPPFLRTALLWARPTRPSLFYT